MPIVLLIADGTILTMVNFVNVVVVLATKYITHYTNADLYVKYIIVINNYELFEMI